MRLFVHLDSAEHQRNQTDWRNDPDWRDDVDCHNDAFRSIQGNWRDDAEISATQQLKMALVALGIEGADILRLAAYAFHADRMGGISDLAPSDLSSRVVIYTMAKWVSSRQSLRSDIVNSATIRAQSLALIVCDTNAVKRHFSVEHGTRKLLIQSPVIPMQDLLVLLRKPCNVERLNEILVNSQKSDSRKRGFPTMAQNKKANLRKHL